MKNNKAFTLIELLVVIAVLAGFMALLVPNYMAVRQKSRDVRRKSDMRAVQKAIELYKQSQTPQAYPANNILVFGGTLSDANGTYMQKVPQDPQPPASYFYAIGVADTGKYTLCACLENKNDPDGSTCTASDGSAVGAPACTGTFYKLNEP